MPAYSQWTPESVEFLQGQAKLYGEMQDAAISTMWGGFQRSLSLPLFKGEEINVPSKLFKKGSFAAYLKKHSAKAPLVVFLPGIFGSYDSNVAGATVHDLENLDIHLLVPPNFLNHKYVAAGPLYDSYQGESLDLDAVKQTIIEAVNKIGKDDVSAIHLVGESLGTAVASALYSTDFELSEYVEKGSLTLVCPPLKLGISVKNFDHMIDTVGKAEQECSNIFYNYPLMAFHFLYQKIPNQMTEDFKACMQNYLYRTVFLKSANKSLEAHLKLKGQSLDEPAQNFSDFFSKYQPSFLEKLNVQDNQTILSYWLKRARDKQLSNIRVLSSQNDFVNNPESWNGFTQSSGLNDKQVLMLPWGGHCAFLGLDGWGQIFSNEFGLKKGTSE